MASLLTGFLTGAVNQLNANFDANKKKQEERDRRREEAADQLKLYMAKGDYDKVNQREAFDYEREARNKDTIAKEIRDLDTYGKTKAIDVGAAKEVDRYKTEQNLREKAYEANLKEAQAKRTQEIISYSLGNISGALSPKGPTGSSQPEAIAQLYQKKAAAEGLQALPETKDIGKAVADQTNTQIQLAEKQQQYSNKATVYPGGDPFAYQKERLKNAEQDQGFKRSIYFSPSDQVRAGTDAHNRSIVKQQVLLNSLGTNTLTRDEAYGVVTNESRLSPAQAEDASFAITRATNIIMSKQASEAEKKKAVADIDLALKLTGVSKDKLLRDPNLAVVFDQDFRNVYNQLAPSVPSKAPEAPGATAETDGTSVSRYPKVVTNGTSKAIVSNAQEEAEANNKGFR